MSLLSILESFKDVKILVVGDFMLDHYTWGSVDRISPEAPVVVVKVNEESIRAGGAGNVAANLCELGAEVNICGLAGDDKDRELLVDRLKTRGSSVDGLVCDPSRQTISKNRVIAHSQQVVRVDRESSEEISQETLGKLKDSMLKQLDGVQGVIVSDYGKGVWSSLLQEALFSALPSGVPVIFDPKPINKAIYRGGKLITPNRKEAEELTGLRINSVEDAVKAGVKIIEEIGIEQALVTLGEKGMVLVKSSSEFTHIDTEAREVFDVSGAGDTVVSVMGLALAAGANSEEAARLANAAAGIVVAEVGTVAIEASKLAEKVA